MNKLEEQLKTLSQAERTLYDLMNEASKADYLLGRQQWNRPVSWESIDKQKADSIENQRLILREHHAAKAALRPPFRNRPWSTKIPSRASCCESGIETVSVRRKILPKRAFESILLRKRH